MPDSERELVAALNNVVRLLHKRERRSGRLRVTEMERAIERAKRAVESMRNDEALVSRFVVSERTTIDIQFLDIRTKFLPYESQALNDAGVAVDAKRLVIREIRRIHREGLRESRILPGDDRESLRENLRELSIELDSLLEQLSRARVEQECKAAAQRSWPQVCRLLAGCALGAANAVFADDAATKQLSIMFGGALVAQALERPRNSKRPGPD